MNPSLNSAFSLRQRSVWEAVDSGVLVWRNSFVYLIPFFAIPLWIAACGLRLLPADFRFVSYLGLWWLKPLFDRLALHVVSRRFFGSPAPAKLKELGRGLWEMRRGLLGDLLWRRFRAGRAAEMPIRVLEHIGVKQFRLRKMALVPGGINFCSFISFMGLLMEGMLLVVEAMFAFGVSAVFFPSAAGYMRDNMAAMENYIFAAFCFNLMLVESLYVCMGFGLYINSRVEVEGWDLQLLFQKLAGPPVKIAIFACLFLVLSHAAHAEEAVKYFPDNFPAVREEALVNLQEILASEDFGGEKEGWSIRFKKPSRQGQRKMPDLNFAPWLNVVRQVSGFILRLFIILAIVCFAGFAFYWLWKNYRNSFRWKGRNGVKNYVNSLLPSESPESLFARAEDFFHRGNLREAWAACFAGCIASFIRCHSLTFPADATEYECLALVRQAFGNETKAFGELVERWILLAYGGRIPGQGAFESALSYGRSILDSPLLNGASGGNGVHGVNYEP